MAAVITAATGAFPESSPAFMDSANQETKKEEKTFFWDLTAWLRHAGSTNSPGKNSNEKSFLPSLIRLLPAWDSVYTPLLSSLKTYSLLFPGFKTHVNNKHTQHAFRGQMAHCLKSFSCKSKRLLPDAISGWRLGKTSFKQKSML